MQDELRGVLTTQSGSWEVTMRLLAPPPAEEKAKPERRRFPQFTRELLLTHQDHRCGICRGPLSLHDAHVDHVVPLAAGGSDDFENLQLVHMNCNLRKGRKVESKDQGRLPWAA